MTVSVTTLPLTYNIRAYGAVGDGTTDDRTAIQSAYTAASAAGGGTVYWPRSSSAYMLGSGLTVGANTVTEFQPGAQAKILPSITVFNVFVSGNVSGVGYRNVYLDGNKANNSAPGAPTTGAVGIYHAPTSGNSTGNFVENCTVINNHGPGYRFQGHNGITDPASLNPGEVNVRNTKISNCQYGVLVLNATAGSVTNCFVEDATTDGIYLFMARGIRVSDNLVEDCGGHGIVSQYIDGCTYTGNTMRRCTLDGFTMGGGTVGNAVNRNFTVSGNVAHDCTLHGFTCDPTITTAVLENVHAAYTGNVSFDNGIHGFYFQCCKYVTFTGNESYGNTQAGLAIQGKYFTFSGNHIHDNTTYGIHLQGDVTTSPAPGVADITGNNLHDNTTANINVTAFNTNVSGATGNKTHDWADLASGAEATTTVTVNGAALGQVAEASMSVDIQAMKLTAYVSAANTVTCVLRNDTGGNINLASGTLRAIVRSVG